jgi:hypothetical protein
MAPVLIAMGTFIGALAGGAVAALILGGSLAILTGTTEQFADGVAGTINSVTGLINNLKAMASTAIGQDELNKKITEFTGALNDATGSANALGVAIPTMSGGIGNVYSVNGAVQVVNSSLKETTSSAKSTASAVHLAAGELTSMSGKASGVYNVSKALAATNATLKITNTETGMVVERLNSIGGQASGVYRVSKAIDQIAFSATKAKTSVDSLAASIYKSIHAAASIAGGALKGSVNSPSFTNLGKPGTATGGVAAYAEGGSFMVGGRGGVDQNRVAFDASRGERVTIETPAQQRRSRNGGSQMIDNRKIINMNVYTPGADSFRRSRKQLSTDLAAAIGA